MQHSIKMYGRVEVRHHISISKVVGHDWIFEVHWIHGDDDDNNKVPVPCPKFDANFHKI